MALVCPPRRSGRHVSVSVGQIHLLVCTVQRECLLTDMFNSPRPQPCVCVLCRLNKCTCVFQCVVCAIKNLTNYSLLLNSFYNQITGEKRNKKCCLCYGNFMNMP